MTASVRTASSSGVHFEFSFNRLSPNGVDIGGGLVRLEEGRGKVAEVCGAVEVRVWAIG